MQILFKVTAHFGYGSKTTATYYVIATDSAKAEKQVTDHHRSKNYSSVDFCHTETIAQAGDYGKPHVLLHNIPSAGTAPESATPNPVESHE